jgi:uncharacterized membrane protein
MPNHLSVIGIIHTVISVIAVGFAVFALVKDGRIDPKNAAGKWYIGLTLFACFSSFLVMKTGHFSGAHGLSVLVLTLLPIAIYAKNLRIFGGKAEYVQVVLMSATLFFSMIPAIVETLTRVPISSPIAASDQSPVIKIGLIILTTLYLVGIIYQIRTIRSGRQMQRIYGSLHL